MVQEYKFERLEVWQLAIELFDLAYELDHQLPKSEQFNLSSQLRRSATSISLNIAEGSTTASNAEFRRYLKIALHSYIETHACYLLIVRRSYVDRNNPKCVKFEEIGAKLFTKLQAFIRSLER
ncbi:MAG: four helix bundle protein [Bacteroidetes bacterium]|nr:MAG: four helix bundle protein [Bacteroidota bacterium]